MGGGGVKAKIEHVCEGVFFVCVFFLKLSSQKDITKKRKENENETQPPSDPLKGFFFLEFLFFVFVFCFCFTQNAHIERFSWEEKTYYPNL